MIRNLPIPLFLFIIFPFLSWKDAGSWLVEPANSCYFSTGLTLLVFIVLKVELKTSYDTIGLFWEKLTRKGASGNDRGYGRGWGTTTVEMGPTAALASIRRRPNLETSSRTLNCGGDRTRTDYRVFGCVFLYVRVDKFPLKKNVVVGASLAFL